MLHRASPVHEPGSVGVTESLSAKQAMVPVVASRTIQCVTETRGSADEPSEQRADDRSADDVPADDAAPEAPAAEEEEWWEADGMPWKKKPGRADIACLSWFGVIFVFSLILLPTRAWLITAAPDWLAMLTGGRTAVAVSGALASQGEMPHWPIVLLVASILSLKFDWIYWWAGKLWGRGMIEVWAGQSKRAARGYARAERWAEKLGPLGFLIAYIPMPLPLMQVVFVLAGATGMSLKRFLIYDYIASTLWLILYFYLGWRFGEPIVDVLEAYAKIAMWVALGLVAFVFISTYLAQKKKAQADAAKTDD